MISHAAGRAISTVVTMAALAVIVTAALLISKYFSRDSVV